ncbi:MAG: aminoglycoside 6-adenylyltransferase, partial [Thermoplasmata archaeon]|nr:aminoglycoside 6-adenylyltransferase [Thermoplasmata archaeon]
MTGPATEAWIRRLQSWATNEPNVRVALLVGSQARTETPADALSDIDLAVFASDPDQILRGEDWISRLGPYWTSHLEVNALGSGQERRVLFQDGQDVDVAVFAADDLPALMNDPRGAAVLRRGFRPLVNKDAIELRSRTIERPIGLPSREEYSNLVNDYWFHLVWAAKKLRRGELLTALEATNGYLRMLLVKTIRWHALASTSTDLDVWHGTRFFEKWADP